MRKIQILGLTLFAALGFSAIAAASAFAEDEWLVNGEKVAVQLTVDFSGEYLLRDENVGYDIDCSELQLVTLLPSGRRVILEVLNLDGTALPLHCLLLTRGQCEQAVEAEVKVEMIDLPWESEILLSGTKFIEDILADGNGNPGFLAECNTILGKVDDSCTGGEVDDELKNVTGGVEGFFSETEEITKSTNCTVGGEKEGLISGSGITTSEEGTVAVS